MISLVLLKSLTTKTIGKFYLINKTKTFSKLTSSLIHTTMLRSIVVLLFPTFLLGVPQLSNKSGSADIDVKSEKIPRNKTAVENSRILYKRTKYVNPLAEYIVRDMSRRCFYFIADRNVEDDHYYMLCWPKWARQHHSYSKTPKEYYRKV